MVTAPEALQQRLRGLSMKELVAVAARFRLSGDPGNIETATKFALRSVARRYQALSVEISELDAQLDRLVTEAAPQNSFLFRPSVYGRQAATLLIVAGDKTPRGSGARRLLRASSAASLP